MTRKPLRILQVVPWSVHGGGTGGMAAVVRDLTGELRRRGHSVEILANAWHARVPTREGPELRLRLPGPPGAGGLLSWAKWPVQREKAARRLLALCRERRIDILHAHYAAPYLAVLRRAHALGGPPYVVTCHRGDVLQMPELSRSRQQAVKTGIAHAAACIAVSRWLAREAANTFGRDDTMAIPNGFDLDRETLLSRNGLEAELGRDLPAHYAVMVANMRTYKGHDVALQAWAQLKAQGTRLPLVLVGNGPDFEAIRELASTLGLGETDVLFLGYQPRDIALSLIRYARMLVAPSRSEGHSITVLEAGTLQTPLVCSEIPAFTDMIADGVTGDIFPMDDHRSLARKIAQALADPEGLRQRALNLHAIVCTDFSISAMIKNYEHVFNDAIGTQNR